MPAQATEVLGCFASNAIHHLIATDPAFQLDFEHRICDLIICHNSHPEQRTLNLVKYIIGCFALYCGHKDGVPPKRNPADVYEALKEARANDAMAATQAHVFLKVKHGMVKGTEASRESDAEDVTTRI